MRIICIEEHAIDLDIAKAAQPALQREAPYIGLQSSVPRPRLKDQPSAVTMTHDVVAAIDPANDEPRLLERIHHLAAPHCGNWWHQAT
jgi:hypothetical protein